MSESRPQRPIKLTIAALGGQGGGVLAEWLVEIAEAEGFLAQSTSVPGVAQRTGATIYYLEFFPRGAAQERGREPIMALMPVPGDVDCVLASELAEAGRMVQRRLVTAERTTVIASLHRAYSIGEKMAMGNGATDSGQLAELVRNQAKRCVMFDMEAIAEKHQSVISSVLLGALCGSGVLPFRDRSFRAAIEHGGIAVNTNLAAFEEACEWARGGSAAAGVPTGIPTGAPADTPAGTPADIPAGTPADTPAGAPADTAAGIPTQARSADLQPLLERVHRLPSTLQSLVLEGVRRMIDYQDPAYAALYLDRVERVVAVDSCSRGGPSWELAAATARGLALWMSFEDTIRVADLKTRASRFARVRTEVRAADGQIIGMTEFMKPRVAEIAGTLPVGLGRWVLQSPRVSGWLTRWAGGKRVRSTTVSGFVLLYALGGLKPWRRGTLRFHEEDSRICHWLERIERLATESYALAVELARAQRLIKGYGETHERGWRNFSTLMQQLDSLAARPDGAALLARLQTAALADEEGKALAAELLALQQALDRVSGADCFRYQGTVVSGHHRERL